MAIIEQSMTFSKDAFLAITEVEVTDIQIISGKIDGTEDDLTSASIAHLSMLNKNVKSSELVVEQLSAVVDGTATGTEMETAEYLILVESFAALLTGSVMDVTIVAQATSLMVNMAVLEAADIESLEVSLTSIEASFATINAMMVFFQADISTLSGEEATE